ncbi:MAG: SUMF1/EgtB/PvdO family nonheme iron enzyme, partial [Myxococcota bacterium]|nr:SUMF1/EgtB/PvdO family nonheme iron enzyme [Myxococcota bacterium]
KLDEPEACVDCEEAIELTELDDEEQSHCPADQAMCDGMCVEVAFNEAHCGNCETVCSATQYCANGGCHEVCPPGYVWLDGATFHMGTSHGDWGFSVEENEADQGRDLQHVVTLSKGFCIAATEMTQAQYLQTMGHNPSQFQACGLDCPVDSVSWHQAAAAANRLSEQQGREPCYACEEQEGQPHCVSAVNPYECSGIRLPTEAEWEYAARSTIGHAFANGPLTYPDCTPLDPVIDEVAWYCGNAGVDYEGCLPPKHDTPVACLGPHPVGGKAPTSTGIYDLRGNLMEFTHDGWGWYTNEHAIDPLGPEENPERSIRGGSFEDRAVWLVGGARWAWDGAVGSYKLGFRTAMTAPCIPNARDDRSCDGVDDDCNGVIDDQGDQACASGARCAHGRCAPAEMCASYINESSALYTKFGGYVRVPHDPVLDVSRGLTLELMVKVENNTALHLIPLIHKRHGSENDEWRSFLLAYWDSGVSQNVLFSLNHSTLETPRNSMKFGRWTHIAATYDGSQMAIYLDGELAAIKPFSEDIIATGESLEFAARSAVSEEIRAVGVIDEIRIWTIARSQDQIKAFLHCSLNEPFPRELIAYYKLDEGEGLIAHDSTVNALHGDLVANPTWTWHW